LLWQAFSTLLPACSACSPSSSPLLPLLLPGVCALMSCMGNPWPSCVTYWYNKQCHMQAQVSHGLLGKPNIASTIVGPLLYHSLPACWVVWAPRCSRPPHRSSSPDAGVGYGVGSGMVAVVGSGVVAVGMVCLALVLVTIPSM
jgi:hypothetical protein